MPLQAAATASPTAHARIHCAIHCFPTWASLSLPFTYILLSVPIIDSMYAYVIVDVTMITYIY